MSATVVAIIGSNRSQGENRLFQLLKSTVWTENIELQLVLIGETWKYSPTANWAQIQLRNVGGDCIFIDESSAARAYNTAAMQATHENILFLDNRVGWTPSSLQLLQVQRETLNELPCVLRNTSFLKNGYPGSPPEALIYPWAMNKEILCINDFLFTKSQFSQIGQFDEADFLGDSTTWDFLLRALRILKPVVIARIDEDISLSNSIDHQAFRVVPKDLIHRYVNYAVSESRQSESITERCGNKLTAFYSDLALDDMRKLFLAKESFTRKRDVELCEEYSRSKLTAQAKSPINSELFCENQILDTSAAPKKLKLLITGSFWEYHHNWLCFYNYLEDLAGTGFATYRVMLDTDVREFDLIGVDLLIISRGKVSAVRQLVQCAKKMNIKTLYMIDDNWLTVGKDWPELYGALFAPGKEFYDTFIYCLEQCDSTLTYSPVLAQDIKSFAANVVSLPTSVDIKKFERVPRINRDNRFLVGYAGSPRFSSAPFEALSAIGQRDDVDILVFGNLHPDHEKLLSGCSLIRRPLLSYQSYVQEIRNLSPDILLAPLDDSRTSRSKCPNKYLEIASAGAVGIYTDIEPYTFYVIDGVNGKLVPADAESHQWEVAINSLLDKKTLKKIADEASHRVKIQNSIEVVSPQFKALIGALVAGS